MKAHDVVRDDFDRIARALESAGDDDVLEPHERALLDLLPAQCGDVLEIGCGDGTLARRVATRARSVLALDLSPEMIRVAGARSTVHRNVEYRVADVTNTDLPTESFDLVLSVATLHHLALRPTIERLAAAMRPGGLLVVQDIVTRDGLRHLPVNALGWLARRVRRLRGSTPAANRRAVAALYEEHGQGERYLTPEDAERAYAELLPGARVVQHLEWRYTAVWQRPDS